MIRALKHAVRHEWRTHPSMRARPCPGPTVFDHHFCAYPGCEVERVLVWDADVRDFVWFTVTP